MFAKPTQLVTPKERHIWTNTTRPIYLSHLYSAGGRGAVTDFLQLPFIYILVTTEKAEPEGVGD